MTGPLRVAVLQSTGLVNSPQENLRRIAARAGEARQLGADILVTPELFVSGYAPSLVHGQDGAAQRVQLADIAASAGLALVASTVEHAGGNHYISASFFGPDGSELTRYRKQHLFGPAERQAFEPGQEQPAVVPFGGINVALGICFDIEFPEFARAAAVAGAELLCIPTAVPLRSGDPGDGGDDHPFDTRLIPSMVVPTRALEKPDVYRVREPFGTAFRRPEHRRGPLRPAPGSRSGRGPAHPGRRRSRRSSPRPSRHRLSFPPQDPDAGHRRRPHRTPLP